MRSSALASSRGSTAAGCTGAGLGSDLFRPGQAPARTRAQARAFVAAYRDAGPTGAAPPR